MRKKAFLVAALLAGFALPAFAPLASAQGPQGAPHGTPANVRGKVVKLAGETLTVKARDGKTAHVALAPNTSVRALARIKLTDIKDGEHVGVTAMPGKGGQLRAVEIHTLPPQVPEAQFPWDYAKGASMTNGAVEAVAKGKSGNTLTVGFKGQTAKIVVDRHTAIVKSVPATMSDVKPGKAVFLRAEKLPDGGYSANNITVEKNGVKPPM